MPRWTSPRASSSVLPWWRVTRAASSSRCSSRRDLNRNIRRTRSMTATRDQDGNALAAARTTASTPAASVKGTCATTSAVAGLKTGRVAAPSGARHSEPTRLRINIDTVLRMAPTARELLEEVARDGSDLETVARRMLERLSDLTGLSSTYLAETRLIQDEQYIVFAVNRSELFHIPEDVTLPWSEGVCRFVVEGAPHYTAEAQTQFASSSVARPQEVRTFVAYSLFTVECRRFGTLCGVSAEQVEIQQEVLELMRECARLIGMRLRRDVSAASSPR